MKSRSLFFHLPALLVMGFSPCVAFAGKAPDALKDLETAVRNEIAAKKPGDEQTDRYGQNIAMGPMVLGQLRNAIARGEPSQVDEVLTQVASYFQSEAVRAAVEKLRTQLRAERAEREKAFAAKIQGALAAAGKAVQSATKPADLDDAIRDLGKVHDSRGERVTENARGQLEKVRATRQFVILWQDYLANCDAGNIQQAVQNLQSASNGNVDLLPRSTILSRIKELSDSKQTSPQGSPADQARKVMANVKSLDDVSGAIAAIDGIRLQPGAVRNDPQDVVMALSSLLNSIEQTYRSFKAGVPADMAITLKKINGSPVNGEAEAMVVPLRAQLMRLVFPRFLGVEEKPKADEPLQAYLNRIMTDASSRLDAKLMGRVFELLTRLDGKNEPVPPALQTLITAQNQDEAGQFALAVISYETALKTGGALVPAKVIGNRLAAIKTEHPSDFALGMERFMAAPEPTPARQRDTRGGAGSGAREGVI